MSAFSFSFSGDDIEEDQSLPVSQSHLSPPNHAAETGTLRRASNSAFPVVGQPMLQPQKHDMDVLLKILPSKIAYSTLVIKLDDGQDISIPRRELWDVRVQLMAEEDDESLGNLGKDDVKTGVYEGGFKSWESSVDVVKELYKKRGDILGSPRRFIELGCGTALPSLAIFQLLIQTPPAQTGGLDIGLADYNPTVLQLVTLPNILLSWAQVTRKASWEQEGELEIDPEVIQDFLASLTTHSVTLSFYSGAWSPEFVDLLCHHMPFRPAALTIVGAETIYSPAALASFADTLMSMLKKLDCSDRTALIAAKKVYFGVERNLGQRPIFQGSAEDIIAQFNSLVAALAQQAPPPDASIKTRDEKADGVPVRIYTPPAADGKKLPVGVYFHGGGYLVGNLDSEDAWCRVISKNTPCIIVSVDYRLSTTHKLPVMLEDSITAYKWAWYNAEKIGGDQSQVFTVGASAGGGLALTVADQVIKSGNPSHVQGVVAMVPVTAHPSSIPAAYKSHYTAYTENARGVPVINADSMRVFFEVAGADYNDEKVFVTLSPRLGELPPVYVATCGKDPLRDDGRVLERMIKDKGGKVRSDHYEGVPHYYWLFPGIEGGEEFLGNVVKGAQWVLSNK
ncbi:hypothetical protein G7Y89_g4094 [Cudoniella acicularis]|uniref:Alpha/beta hydrolase fold-3 domain-containing protein n=1 Tax=Cudoniella acicularis TaxID=354080 RepID=A0A8H4W508_9HELO|nr:hypothetical protein G7Y89_g4094 [Cudoniella acicularis]